MSDCAPVNAERPVSELVILIQGDGRAIIISHLNCQITGAAEAGLIVECSVGQDV